MSMRASRWGVTVLALAVGLGCSGPEETTSPPAEPGPVVAALAERCPDPATPIPYPSRGRLPDGAVAVRLCNGTEDFGGVDDFQADVQVPTDELTDGVDQLTGLVNAMEPVDTGQACPADAGPNLVFWFRYADGSARAVRYERAGCRDVFVGEDQRRSGGEELNSAFSALLLDQRKDLQPAGGPPHPDCSQPEDMALNSALDVTEVVDLERAAICLDVQSSWRQSRELTPPQVQRLEEDFHVIEASRGRECRPWVYTRVVAFTAWGDRLDLWGACWDFEVPSIQRASGSPRYRPSPGVQRMLQRVAGSETTSR